VHLHGITVTRGVAAISCRFVLVRCTGVLMDCPPCMLVFMSPDACPTPLMYCFRHYTNMSPIQIKLHKENMHMIYMFYSPLDLIILLLLFLKHVFKKLKWHLVEWKYFNGLRKGTVLVKKDFLRKIKILLRNVSLSSYLILLHLVQMCHQEAVVLKLDKCKREGRVFPFLAIKTYSGRGV